MIKNYIKIAWRNLTSKKLYSFINILGLAVGIFCCLLISLYVQDELSYDKFNDKSDRIFRVASEMRFGGNDFRLATAPAPMGPTLKEDYPSVEQAVRFRRRGAYLVRHADKVFKEEQVTFVDSTLFDVFTFEFVHGNPATALLRPYTLVLTQEAAEKYFGTINPVGQTLLFDGHTEMEVTGVVKKLPHNSHFNFSMYASMATIEDSREANWLSNNYNTYILFNKPSDAVGFSTQLDQLVESYVMPQAYQMLDATKEQMTASGNKVKYYLQPLTDIHLYSDLTAELSANGSMQYVYIFSAIALFVLLIACINFMNLSTARSAGRAREVGIRKALGSYRRSLIGQFLFESILLSAIAFILAIAGAQLALPYFNELSGKNFDVAIFADPLFLGGVIAAALFIGLLAGLYPAFFLSSFQPVKVLKGSITRGPKNGRLRSILVIMQFAVSIILIISTFVIYRQLQYVQKKNLGYEKDQVLLIHNAYALDQSLEVYKDNLLRQPDISDATVTSYLPVPSSRSDTPFFTGGKMTNDNSVSLQYWAVDYDYLSMMKMKLAEGRNFSREMGMDSSAIIINQRAADLFGFDDPVGKEINRMESFTAEKGYSTYHIIGVIEDFHFESLRENIGAVALYLGRSRSFVAVRFSATSASDIVEKARAEWQKIASDQPFSYSFMNNRFDAVYRTEKRVGEVVGIFSILAIFVACLGLFAMAAFTAEQRTKEIGIRKVLGAGITDILVLLSRDYVRLVIISFFLALPIGWLLMRQWLQDFAYKTDLSIWIFAGAGLITLIVALATVSWQSLKATMMNPVDSLRSE